MKFLPFFLLVPILLAAGCSQPSSDLESACCWECTNAFRQSQASLGPEAARCGGFPTSDPLSERCIAYFEGNDLTVSQCELGSPPALS